MKFHVYKDLKGEWRWRLKAGNGRIVADSAESYQRRSSITKAINAIRKASVVMVSYEADDS